MASMEQVKKRAEQTGSAEKGFVADVILQAIFGLSRILMKAQEEFIVISFSSMQRTCYTGSKLGRDFLKTHKDVIGQFLQHCAKDKQENKSESCDEAVESCDENSDDTAVFRALRGVSKSDQQRDSADDARQIEQRERTSGDLGSEYGTHALGKEDALTVSNVATLGNAEKTDESIDKTNTKEVTSSSVNDIHGNLAVNSNSQEGKTNFKEKNCFSDQINVQNKESTCPQNCAKVTKHCTNNKLSSDPNILKKYGVKQRQDRCMYLSKFLTDEVDEYEVSKSGMYMDQEDRDSMFGDLSRFISVKPLKCLIKERKDRKYRLFNKNMDDQEIELEEEFGDEEFSYKIVRGRHSSSFSGVSPCNEGESMDFGEKENVPDCIETATTGEIESMEMKTENFGIIFSSEQKKDNNAKNLEFKHLDRVGEEEISYAEIHVKTDSKIEHKSKGRVDDEERKMENIKKECIVNSEDDFVGVCEVRDDSKNNTVYLTTLNERRQNECTPCSVLTSNDILGTKNNFTDDFHVDISSNVMEGLTQKNLVNPLMLDEANEIMEGVTSESEISLPGIRRLNNTVEENQGVDETLPPDLEHCPKTSQVFPISMINVKDFLAGRKTPRHSYSETQRKFFDDDNNENSVCSFCDSRFPNDYSLQLHISYMHHDGQTVERKKTQQKKKYIKLSKSWDRNRRKLCNKAFPTVAKLIMHKRMLHSKNNDKMVENYSKHPLRCQTCKRIFVNEVGLKTHERQCKKKRPSLNGVENNTVNTEVFNIRNNNSDREIDDLDNHVDAKPTQKSDRWSSCSEEICVDDVSDSEVIISSNELSLKCSECSVTFDSKSKLKYHMEHTHNVDIFCNICKKLLVYDNKDSIPSCTCVNRISDRTIVQKDSNSRKRKLQQQCPFCCEHFSNFAVLKQHTYICPKNEDPDGFVETTNLVKRSRKPAHIVRSDFKDDEDKETKAGEIESDGKGDGLECNECGKIYKTEKLLRVHRRHNHGNRHIQNSYKCNVCGKMFSKEISLNAHMHICSNRSNMKSGHMTRSTSKSKGVVF